MTAPSVRRALQLLPHCATTGIGSLPHTQQELALQMALQVDVPFLPQLPAGHPSELMIASALDGVPGLSFDDEGMCTIDLGTFDREGERYGREVEAALQSGSLSAFEPSVQACRSWRPFIWEVENRRLPFAKVQLAGPATVRWVARTSEGKPASEHPALERLFLRLVLAKALAMVRAVRKVGATPILFLDEPGLYALDRREVSHLLLLSEMKLIVAALQREGALVGVHCCSNTHWASLLELGLDILSIDARLSLDAVMEERARFLQFLANGSTLDLGVIPTDVGSTYDVEDLVESVEASLRATLPAAIPLGQVVAQMPLTPACGLAMRSVVDAERIFDELRQAQRRLRTLAALEGGSQPASPMPS